MRIRRDSDEQIRARWAAHKGRTKDEDAPPPINREALRLLSDHRALGLPWGDYRVLPIPLEVGMQIQDILRTLQIVRQAQLDALGSGALTPADADRDYFNALRRARDIGNRLLRPIGRRMWLRRLLWRWGLHKPLRLASEGELSEVLGFLSGLRTKQGVRFPSRNGTTVHPQTS